MITQFLISSCAEGATLALKGDGVHIALLLSVEEAHALAAALMKSAPCAGLKQPPYERLAHGVYGVSIKTKGDHDDQA